MTEDPQNKPSEIEAWLDRQIDAPGEATEVPTEFVDGVQLQSEIDNSLTRLFGTEKTLSSLMPDDANVVETETENTSSFTRGQFFAIAASLAAIAGIAWLLSGGGEGNGSGNEVHFAQQPLTEVYRKMDGRGFTPTYVCDDNKRMAIEFDHKLGVGLQLVELPQGTEMLGLAYPGGISRDTMAMLGRSSGQNILVFVDRTAESLDDELQKIDLASADLRVFEKEQFGLNFYEVTPLDEPIMMELFERAEPDPNYYSPEKTD